MRVYGEPLHLHFANVSVRIKRNFDHPHMSALGRGGFSECAVCVRFGRRFYTVPVSSFAWYVWSRLLGRQCSMWPPSLVLTQHASRHAEKRLTSWNKASTPAVRGGDVVDVARVHAVALLRLEFFGVRVEVQPLGDDD